jgi:uncharacterized protein (TIGR02266 family)
MSEERRSAPRARLSGARVAYESAAGGDRVEADATNLGRGGLMVLTETPLAVGKRITLEIQVPGNPATWTALGRVIWAREYPDGDGKPAGMGVKLIDVEDEALDAIEKLIEVDDDDSALEAALREGPPPPGVIASPIVSIPSPAPLERERTILGVGAFPRPPSSPLPPAPSTPPPAPVMLASPPPQVSPDIPTPEAFPAAMPKEPMRPREPSIAFELLHKERTPSVPPPRPKHEVIDEAPPQKAFAAPRVSDPPPPRAAKKSGNAASWWLVAIVLAAAAAAAYWFLGGEPEHPAGTTETPSAEPSTSAPVVRLPPPAESASAAPGAAAPSAAVAATAAPSATAAPQPAAPPVFVPAKRPPGSYPLNPAITPPSPAGHGPGLQVVVDGGGRVLQVPRPLPN